MAETAEAEAGVDEPDRRATDERLITERQFIAFNVVDGSEGSRRNPFFDSIFLHNYSAIVQDAAPVQEEVRELDDPRAMRALAHPLRLKLLALLRQRESATATDLARALDESTAQTSYHLRTLARYGLIEEAERRDARERRWRATAAHFRFSAGARSSPEYERAAAQLRARILERDADIVGRYLFDEGCYSAEWQEAALFANEIVEVTPSELEAIDAAIVELLAPYKGRRGRRAAGRLPVHIAWRAVPYPDELS